MPVNIEGYSFSGPHSIDATFKPLAGVYIIYTADYTSKKWLDVGETDNLANRISSHERRLCWKRNAEDLKINLAFLQINNEQRRLTVEAKLRKKLNPICGEK